MAEKYDIVLNLNRTNNTLAQVTILNVFYRWLWRRCRHSSSSSNNSRNSSSEKIPPTQDGFMRRWELFFWGGVISNTCLWLVLFGKSQVLCAYCGTLVWWMIWMGNWRWLNIFRTLNALHAVAPLPIDFGKAVGAGWYQKAIFFHENVRPENVSSVDK